MINNKEEPTFEEVAQHFKGLNLRLSNRRYGDRLPPIVEMLTAAFIKYLSHAEVAHVIGRSGDSCMGRILVVDGYLSLIKDPTRQMELRVLLQSPGVYITKILKYGALCLYHEIRSERNGVPVPGNVKLSTDDYVRFLEERLDGKTRYVELGARLDQMLQENDSLRKEVTDLNRQVAHVLDRESYLRNQVAQVLDRESCTQVFVNFMSLAASFPDDITIEVLNELNLKLNLLESKLNSCHPPGCPLYTQMVSLARGRMIALYGQIRKEISGEGKGFFQRLFRDRREQSRLEGLFETYESSPVNGSL